MSKGGLLYHFRSKEDLLLALVEHRHCLLEDAIRDAEATDPSPELPGRHHRGLIRAMFRILRSAEPFQLSFMAGITVQLMASGGHHHHALQDKFQAKMEGWKTMVQEDGLPEIRSWMIRCSIDGLISHQLMFQTAPVPELMKQMEDHLLLLAGANPHDHPTSTPLPQETV